MKFRGIFPIVATPFTTEGQIDEEALRRVVQFCLACQVDGLVWPAVASEFYSLTDDERIRHVRTVIEEAAGRVPVVVGVSAPSRQGAVRFARDAVSAGAAAVMALPPYVVKEDAAGVADFYRAIGEAAAGVPVILQNADPPMGQALAPQAIARMVADNPAIKYVKEETVRSVQALSLILRETGGTLDGVFGGAGGRYLISEYTRGACGAMPACEFSDVFVSLWDHLERHEETAARAMFERLLPLLMMQATLRMAFTKEVLAMRGVALQTHNRISGGMVPDAYDLAEIRHLLARVDADLVVKS